MKKCFTLAVAFVILTFNQSTAQNLEIVVLGIAQDAGYPQANCQEDCCQSARSVNSQRVMVSSLGVLDLNTNEYYLIDCTPDFKEQLHTMSNYSAGPGKLPSGIFLTHAHIGHYLGLVELGKEVMNTNEMPVYTMPKMSEFLRSNGPWEQLISNENIDLKPLENNQSVVLSDNLSITPILVPHRDEYSETVGFIIKGESESLLYIPDIDKWEKWDQDISEYLRNVDHAIIDGTFYADGEIKNRDMKDIPHPFVSESIEHMKDLSPLDKSKIHFTHFNHTNPLLNKKSISYKSVYLNGFNVASQGLSFYLE